MKSRLETVNSLTFFYGVPTGEGLHQIYNRVPGKGRKELWGPAAGLPACVARTPPLCGWVVNKNVVCCYRRYTRMADFLCCAVDTSAPRMTRHILYFEPAQTTNRSLIFYHIQWQASRP